MKILKKHCDCKNENIENHCNCKNENNEKHCECESESSEKHCECKNEHNEKHCNCKNDSAEKHCECKSENVEKHCECKSEHDEKHCDCENDSAEKHCGCKSENIENHCNCKSEHNEKHCECESESSEKHCDCENAEKHNEKHCDCKNENIEKTSCSCGVEGSGGGCVGCAKPISKSKTKSFVVLGISLLALIVSFISPLRHHAVLRWFDFGYIAVILCGIPVFSAAIDGLKRRKITSSLLISISILACIALEILTLSGALVGGGHGHSNIFAAGEVSWLMAVGGLIEDFTVSKARSGIENLMALSPTIAKYRIGEKLVEKQLSEVQIGDIVTVLPGDIISVDGEIFSGSAAVNESILTGESVPVDKTKGDKVFGGTLNTNSSIEVKVTRATNEMAVNKLKDLVLEAEGKKAPISKTADKWAGIIVPAAMVLSVIIFLLNYFVPFKYFSTNNLGMSILRGVTMLVVFCPCALALATPTAIAAGLGASSRRGILIKSGGALEAMAKVKTVALDKTGTLSQGRLIVDGIFTQEENTSHLEAIAGACESLSSHPIAKAIFEYCFKRVKLPLILESKLLIGSGVEGVINGKKCSVIKWENAKNYAGVTREFSDVADGYLAQGKTLSAVIEEGKILGLIALSDEIKPDAAAAIEELGQCKINAIMLTGDNESSASAMGKKLGINYLAGLLPQEKLDAIESLKKDGLVCMVGDGVNDAPALAAADCSIAMAALGSDTAIETADVALMTGDVKKVSWLMRFSRKVLFTIKFNIILSLSISFVSIILSALGVLDPISGALVHNISSVLVVTNSALLLLRKSDAKKNK